MELCEESEVRRKMLSAEGDADGNQNQTRETKAAHTKRKKGSSERTENPIGYVIGCEYSTQCALVQDCLLGQHKAT